MNRMDHLSLPVTLLGAGLVALTLAGCAGGTGVGLGATGSAKPKLVVVSDFIVSSDVEAIDRGFSVRMDRKDPNFPILERKRRTLARVNDEIVAAIIATLREAGLDAEPGAEDRITLKEQAVLVSGHLRPANLSDLAKKKPIGFGPGHAPAAADMTVSSFSSFGGKRQLLAFGVQAHGKSPAGNRKQAAARDALIQAALAAEGTAAVRLSPDVEGQARALGVAIGDKIAAFAREQGWLTPGETAATEAAPAAAPAATEAAEKPTPVPPRRPQGKPVRQIKPQALPKSEQPAEPEPAPQAEPQPDQQPN